MVASLASVDFAASTAQKGNMIGCKFLFMADHHVVDVRDRRDAEAYPMWTLGDHAALARTYEFIGADPFCRDVDFALFAGDQLNTGYMNRRATLEAERGTYYRTLGSLDLHRRTKGTDLSELDFRAPDTFLCRGDLPEGYVQRPIPFRRPDSRVIAIQGNHDTAVEDFCRECSFRCGDTRFITFFAEYIGLPAPPGEFRSTARVSDEAVAFIGREMEVAAADPGIRHIVLVSHWGIVLGNPEFRWPIFDACAENGWNDNRRRIVALAARYGCDLYLHGHEHRSGYPVGRAGTLNVVNAATVTAQKGPASFAVVEMLSDRARFHVYSRAVAEEIPSGGVRFTALPRRLSVREIKLTPIR